MFDIKYNISAYFQLYIKLYIKFYFQNEEFFIFKQHSSLYALIQ
jgi:hypothetical protein